MAHSPTATDDLRGIVQHLRPTRGGAAKDPNDPLVGQLLECAIEILTEAYLNVTHRPPGKFAPRIDFMAPVSWDATAKKFNEKHNLVDLTDSDEAQPLTPRRIHTYWSSTTEFHEDVLNYLYRPGVHRPQMVEYVKQFSSLQDKLFGDLVQEIAESELEQLGSDNSMRIQTALPILFPNHEKLRELAESVYLRQHKAWIRLYELVLEKYALSLVPGRSVSELQCALNVAVIGHLPRVNMASRLLQKNSGESLLVSMIQDILCAYTGLPWAELADRMPTNDIDLR